MKKRYFLKVYYRYKNKPYVYDLTIEATSLAQAKSLAIIEWAREEKEGVFERIDEAI